MAKLKSLVVALVVFLALGCYGQTAPAPTNSGFVPSMQFSSGTIPFPVIWYYTNGTTFSNGVAIVPPSSGISANPADDLQAVLNVIPTKYKSLAAAIFALLLVGGRIWASVNAGGTFSAALGNLIKGHSQSAKNEIAQIKSVIALPPTPAPPAPTQLPPTNTPIAP